MSKTTLIGILSFFTSLLPVIIQLLSGTGVTAAAASLPVFGATTALGFYHTADAKPTDTSFTMQPKPAAATDIKYPTGPTK